MRVSSVLGIKGAQNIVPQNSSEVVLSEFAYLPKKHPHSSFVTPTNFKKLLVGLAAIAVAITLSRVKAPLSKPSMDLLNILC